jgi:MFS family permease
VDGVRAYVAAFRGFEPDARRFLLSAFLVGGALSLYWIDFNLYLSALGIDTPTIGLIATTGSLAGALVAFPASRASDRLGRRAVLIAGVAFMALALAGLVVVTAPLVIAMLVFVYVGGQQAFWVVQNPFLMERSRPEHRSELFAVAFAVESVTNVAAVVVGGILAQAIATAGGFDASGPETFRILLIGMACVMTLALAALARLSDDRPSATRDGEDPGAIVPGSLDGPARSRAAAGRPFAGGRGNSAFGNWGCVGSGSRIGGRSSDCSSQASSSRSAPARSSRS